MLKKGDGVNELIWDQGLTLTYTDSARFDILRQTYQGVIVEGEGSMLLEKISFRYHSLDTTSKLDCLVTANLTVD